jgi:hypothetical protein
VPLAAANALGLGQRRTSTTSAMNRAATSGPTPCRSVKVLSATRSAICCRAGRGVPATSSRSARPPQSHPARSGRTGQGGPPPPGRSCPIPQCLLAPPDGYRITKRAAGTVLAVGNSRLTSSRLAASMTATASVSLWVSMPANTRCQFDVALNLYRAASPTMTPTRAAPCRWAARG